RVRASRPWTASLRSAASRPGEARNRLHGAQWRAMTRLRERGVRTGHSRLSRPPHLHHAPGRGVDEHDRDPGVGAVRLTGPEGDDPGTPRRNPTADEADRVPLGPEVDLRPRDRHGALRA